MSAAEPPIWLAAGLRTPFARVDGPLAGLDALALSVPVAKAMADQVSGPIDLSVWGSVAVNLAYSNLAREVWLEAKLDPHVPAFTTILQCCTSMAGAFEAAGILRREGGALAMVGGSESLSRVQVGLDPNLSVWLRRLKKARTAAARLQVFRALRLGDLRLYVPEVKNRATGRSMGEHCEEMAKEWKIGRKEQDEFALESHGRAVAARERGLFDDLVPVEGLRRDEFPRRDTSLEKLAALKPAFDRAGGTITAGNSSPLTDGAAAVWVATSEGLSRLPAAVPRARLVDFEMAAVDIFREGLLMAPVAAIPRLLARHSLAYEDIALWEIHEAFAAQVLCNIQGLEDAAYVREKAGVPHTFGRFPRERMNPNGGSIALGHPFGATGARILTQAVRELAARRRGAGESSACARTAAWGRWPCSRAEARENLLLLDRGESLDRAVGRDLLDGRISERAGQETRCREPEVHDDVEIVSGDRQPDRRPEHAELRDELRFSVGTEAQDRAAATVRGEHGAVRVHGQTHERVEAPSRPGIREERGRLAAESRDVSLGRDAADRAAVREVERPVGGPGHRAVEMSVDEGVVLPRDAGAAALSQRNQPAVVAEAHQPAFVEIEQVAGLVDRENRAPIARGAAATRRPEGLVRFSVGLQAPDRGVRPASGRAVLSVDRPFRVADEVVCVSIRQSHGESPPALTFQILSRT